MFRFFLVITLLISSAGFAQDSTNTIQSKDTSVTKNLLDDTQHFLDSIKNEELSKNISQGLDNLIRYQKEQRARQRKQAILYIGIGVFFLVILVVGLMRRPRSAPGK